VNLQVKDVPPIPMSNGLEIPEQIAVFITAPNIAEAGRLAEMLVGSHLAACVQLLPEMESIYRWKGKIERAGEVLLIAKTIRSKFAQLESEVRASHSYETPEIVALPIIDGSQPYLEWLAASVKE
jgi:periplasmic divalent cation tolerance protein